MSEKEETPRENGGFLARPERFERPTPRFVDRGASCDTSDTRASSDVSAPGASAEGLENPVSRHPRQECVTLESQSPDEGGAESLEDIDAEIPDLPEDMQDEADAALLLDAMLSFDDRRARVERQAKTLKERIEKAHKHHLELIAQEESLVSAHALPLLRSWFDRHPPAKGKTIHLATGSVGLAWRGGTLRTRDRAKTVEWAKEHAPECVVQAAPDVDLARIKLRIGNGDPPPGMERSPRREELVLSPPRGAR